MRSVEERTFDFKEGKVELPNRYSAGTNAPAEHRHFPNFSDDEPEKEVLETAIRAFMGELY